MTTTTQQAPTGHLLIGDDDVRGSGAVLRAVDPRTGAALEPAYSLGGAADVARAAKIAWEAFAVLRASEADARAGLLDGIAEEIAAITDDLVPLVTAETGIPPARVQGELARTVNQLRLFAEVVREGSYLGARIDPAQPDRQPLPRPEIRQRKVPLGPVAVFAASNFPLAFSVAGGDTASALAAGCPVIVKAHSSHPGTSELVGRAVRRAVQAAGFPEGTFSLLLGPGAELGTALVQHPLVKAVGFTGSRSGGLALVRAATERPVPIPVYAEMSSVNPVFVLAGALRARAAELGKAYIASVTTGVGQLCTSPGLVFAMDGPGLETFLQSAAEAVTAAQSQPMLGAAIRRAYEEGVTRLRETPGVTTVAAGPDDASIAVAGRAWLLSSDARTFLDNPQLSEEVFGAASLVVKVRDLTQLREIVGRLEGQLTATVHLDDADLEDARSLLPDLEQLAGRVLVNGWPTGVEVGHAVVHGGPFPATSAPSTTSVGTRAIERFLRPVSYQNLPAALLPPELRDENPRRLWRRVDGRLGEH